MKKYFLPAGLYLLLATVACNRAATKNSSSITDLPESSLGWKLGAQSYTFNKFTFEEALNKIDSCGLRYVEAFPGQEIGAGIEGKMDFHMDAAKRERVLALLKRKNITLVAYGVVKLDSEQDWRQLFEFGKAMNIHTFTMEPDDQFLDLVSELCDKYQINAAFHNHPKPSLYWDPEVVLAAIKGRSSRMGACADIGHWVRSGLNPVECLKKLEGHVFHSHMKDLNEKGVNAAHDVHWGTGVSDLPAVIAELKRQKFAGMISAEYEYNWYNSVPDVKASVAWFRSSLK